MEAKELRIGNLVDTAVGIIRIEEIPLKSNPLYNPNALHPIPLTSEWLDRMGFEKTGEFYNRVGEEFSGCLYEDRFELVWYELAPCRYVHQLQNLYFALTGEELTVKDFLHK